MVEVIKAVIFDMDNTLIDFGKMKSAAVDAALDAMIRAGLNIPKEQASKTLYEIYFEHGIEYQQIFQKFLKKVVGKIDYKIMAAGILAYRRVKDRNMDTYHMTRPTLELLKQRYKLCVITDAPTLQAWLRLMELGIENYFDFVITPLESKAKKPTGLPFKLALKKLGLKPEECVMVGDWPSRDLEPARKLGIKTIWAKYGIRTQFSNAKIENANADGEIDSLEELAVAIEKIN